MVTEAGLTEYAWFVSNDDTIEGNGGFTSDVKELKPNAFGLYDMWGNAFEWTLDGYDPEAFPLWASRSSAKHGGIVFFGWTLGGDPILRDPGYLDSIGEVPLLQRVNRGGSVNLASGQTRSGYRAGRRHSETDTDLGFRCVSGFSPVAIDR
jgi:formylglycine-generating enzyme required for sulfatase activity